MIRQGTLAPRREANDFRGGFLIGGANDQFTGPPLIVGPTLGIDVHLNNGHSHGSIPINTADAGGGQDFVFQSVHFAGVVFGNVIHAQQVQGAVHRIKGQLRRGGMPSICRLTHRRISRQYDFAFDLTLLSLTKTDLGT